MLKIRLARHGRRKRPFYRIVLTEHTRPPQSGYISVLGFFNPLTKEVQMDTDAIKAAISKGAKPSERVAKLAHSFSQDDFFAQYYTKKDIARTTKNPDKYE